MEDFSKIKWSWSQIRTAKEQEQFYQCNLSDDERDVFYNHINEIDPVHLLESNFSQENNITNQDRSTEDNSSNTIIVDPRTGKKIIKFIIQTNKTANNNLFQNFPNNSKLSDRQHSAAIRVLENRSMGKKLDLSVSEKVDLEIFNQIMNGRQQERKLYLNFVRQHFFSHTINRCQNINQALNEFFIAKRKLKLEELHETIPKKYKIATAILLKNTNLLIETSTKSKNDNNKITIHLVDTLEKHNNYVCKYTKELLQTNLRQSFQCMTKMLENNKNPSSSTINNSMLILEKMAVNHQVNFAFNLSTLCALLDYSMNFNCTWDIPFHIRNSTKSDIKIILICKPLVEQYVCAKKRNQMGYKWRIKACLKQKEINDNNNYTDNTLSSISPSSSSSSSINNQLVPKYKVYEFDEYLKLFGNAFIENKSIMEKTYPEVHNNSNYISQIWNIKSAENYDENLRILIRSKISAVDTSDSNEVLVNFSIKIEYQVEFGAEQMTCSELIHEWCRQKFCPESVTERVRIDVSTGCILSIKRLSLEDIEYDLNRLYKIKSNHLLTNLYGILKSLQKLPPQDNYLLRHTPDNNENAMIYTVYQSNETNNNNNSNILDLHKLYEIEHYEPSPIDLIEWIPIDDMEIMPVHRTSNVMPCAFPFNGKKKNYDKLNVRNDREKVIKVAEMKRKQTETAIAEKEHAYKVKIKAEINKKKSQTRKRKQLRMNETPPGVTLDPYEIFDKDGNINVSTIISGHKIDEKIITEPPPSSTTSSSSPLSSSSTNAYNYNDYVREAFGSSSSKLKEDEQQESII